MQAKEMSFSWNLFGLSRTSSSSQRISFRILLRNRYLNTYGNSENVRLNPIDIRFKKNC